MTEAKSTASVEEGIADELSFATQRVPEPGDFQPFESHPLYFGITRPIGTHTESVLGEVESKLTQAGYYTKRVRLSDLIARTYADMTKKSLPPNETGERRDVSTYRGLMRAGDMLRLMDPAMVGKLAVLEINSRRAEVVQEALLAERPSRRTGIAYLITHLMHPAEVHTLRAVYGERFFLIAANAQRIDRQSFLESEFSKSLGDKKQSQVLNTDVGAPEEGVVSKSERAQQLARELIAIDAGITSSVPHLSPKTKLSVDDTFHLADLFVRSRAENKKPTTKDKEVDRLASIGVARFMEQVLSFPFGSPTSQESAMAAAYLGARSSVALGRSVGAALVDANGSVISIGWNEVAKPSGGPYRESDDPDYRDHVNGFDPSDVSRIDAIRSFLENLLNPAAWIDSLKSTADLKSETKQWLESLAAALPAGGLAPSTEIVAGFSALPSFDRTRIMHLIEFGRSVHAEMAALSDAFRRGVGGAGTSMFVTTFPCHECCRNLISFGIQEVVYVEPYGKSMAEALYRHEIDLRAELQAAGPSSRVVFVPFEGVAPRAIDALFSTVRRKHGLRDSGEQVGVGNAVTWDIKASSLRPAYVGYPPGYAMDKVNPELECARLATELIVASSVVGEIRKRVMEIQDPDR